MSAGNTTRFKLDPDHPPRLSRKEEERLDRMSEEDVEEAARSDPDAPPLTDKELKRFRRVPDVRGIRRRLKMTQAKFAATFHLSLATVRDWEQGRYQPDQAARTLLRVIEREPKAVRRALHDTP
jgi:putative transcriptional regulator